MTMNVKLGGFVFVSDFDSGNLGRVELDSTRQVDDDNSGSKLSGDETSSSSTSPSAKRPSRSKKAKSRVKLAPPSASEARQPASGSLVQASTPATDTAFNVWTRPDCHGTDFENGNRTWFCFGVMRDPAYPTVKSCHTVRLTVRNLNKQSKLFSQGMVPVYVTQTAKKAMSTNNQPPCTTGCQKWERLRDRPVFWSDEGNFVVSFRIKVDLRHVTYVAFTFPYTYKELQAYLSRLERKHSTAGASYSELKLRSHDDIYFIRENIMNSLEGRRVDMLTITSVNEVTAEREHFLENLFPQVAEEEGDRLRPHRFRNKKVVFISARVHPGETQSSFVMTGLIRFLLRENDPRAIQLRRRYVFKLIPMLNPDGVVKGHYRTDCRGVNLNRVYVSPSLDKHPQIYAARKLLLYYHYGYEIFETAREDPDSVAQDVEDSLQSSSIPVTHWLRSSFEIDSPSKMSSLSSPGTSSVLQNTWYEMTETSRFSEGDESIADFSYGIGSVAASTTPKLTPGRKTSSSNSGMGRTSFRGAFSTPSSPRQYQHMEDNELGNGHDFMSGAGKKSSVATDVIPIAEDAQNERIDVAAQGKANEASTRVSHACNKPVRQLSTEQSGLFLYVDIHGHASKRGIFMYGNHFKDMETKVDSMLLPKLMSLNCANFDFPACNFTERNMYLKDRHTGAGREGSGRVSAFKATGLIYSYTLECNFNTGRLVNSVPMASRDCGRATPPPNLDTPPKYDPGTFEDAGKALAISILDMTESNPWTRLTCSACKNLRGVKESIRKYLKENEVLAAQKSMSSQNKSDSSVVKASPKKGRNATRKKTLSAKTTGSRKSAPPGSPDVLAYRPVSKVARKNSSTRTSSSQAQVSSSTSEVAPTSRWTQTGKIEATKGYLLTRSRSIPGVSALASTVLPLLKDGGVIVGNAGKAGKKASPGRSLRKSQSTPNSRPGSPRRLVATSLKMKTLKKKKKIGSRKASDASTMSTETTQSSPSRKTLMPKAKGKKKGRRGAETL